MSGAVAGRVVVWQPHSLSGWELPRVVRLGARERRGSALSDPDRLTHGRSGRAFVEASQPGLLGERDRNQVDDDPHHVDRGRGEGAA